MKDVVKELYQAHYIELENGYFIESSPHNSYTLKKRVIIRTGENKGSERIENIAYGDSMYLVKRYVQEAMHNELAGETVNLKEYVDKYNDISERILNILEDQQYD